LSKILPKFAELGISEETLLKLQQKWFEEPSPIQEKTIPLLLQWDVNIIWQAQTWTGKTAAFGIPLAEKIQTHEVFTQAIVLTPTRELAVQVAEEIRSFLHNKKINVVTIYGGQSYTLQKQNLRRWADIIVATPGRLMDHLDKWVIKLEHIEYFILDEADEMLNMWFIDDIKKILGFTNDYKSMLLFSATMPKAILNIAKKYMPDYKLVSIEKKQMTATETDQIYFEVNARDKFEALCRIIDIEPEFFWIIFCKTKVDVDFVSSKLAQRGYLSEALHWDVQQKQREQILKRFKSWDVTALVATDVAARGIDVNNVSHVINYTLPWDPESYVHRVGRTWRAWKKGTAITFVTPNEYRKIVFFKRVTKTDIRLEKIPKVADIIAAKKIKLAEDIQFHIDQEWYKEQLDLAKSLLENNSPEDVIASLLSFKFKNEFSEKRYKDLSSVNVNKTWKSRLFIALGRAKGYTPGSLIDHICTKTQIEGKAIQELKMMEDFSFITVPFEEAEIILHVFNKNKKWGRSLVSKAKDNRGGWGSRWGTRWWYKWGNRGDRKSGNNRSYKWENRRSSKGYSKRSK